MAGAEPEKADKAPDTQGRKQIYSCNNKLKVEKHNSLQADGLPFFGNKQLMPQGFKIGATTKDLSAKLLP